MVPNFTWEREEVGRKEVSDEIFFFWWHEAKLKLTHNFWVFYFASTTTNWRELSRFHQASDLSCYRKVHFLTKEQRDHTHENPSAKVFFQGNTVDFSFSHVFPRAAVETRMEFLSWLQNRFGFLCSSTWHPWRDGLLSPATTLAMATKPLRWAAWLNSQSLCGARDLLIASIRKK